MCGLAGFIGRSKNPTVSYQLITRLFEKSDSRGIDAAGFWGTETGINGKVLYHKEPGRSSVFIKKEVWRKNSKFDFDLLFTHARGASKGVGLPCDNLNNHPFTSFDKSVGLIHNGRIDQNEYQLLKNKYELKSTCDSELILRIIEAAEYYETQKDLDQRLLGIRDVFNFINEGHMAVALGERFENGDRAIWLFRNKHRPLWIIDVRDLLGQIFFVSDPLIWKSAVKDCALDKFVFHSQKLVELPTEEIWHTKISSTNTTPEILQKFAVKKQKPISIISDFQKIVSVKKNRNFELVTGLDEDDHVNGNSAISSVDFHKKCNKIIYLINDIKKNVVSRKDICDEDYRNMMNFIDTEIQKLEEFKKETLL